MASLVPSSTAPTQTSATVAGATSEVLPSQKLALHAFKNAIEKEKPILLDYWKDSHLGKISICVTEDGNKILLKNKDEYTSSISSMSKTGNELMIITENSIYLISANVKTRKINSQMLQSE
jgi:hypothetical protein